MQTPPLSPRHGPDFADSVSTPATPRVSSGLTQPSKKHRSRSAKVFRGIRSAFRAFPILNPPCRHPAGSGIPSGSGAHDGHIRGATRMTGTLFGPRKSRISLAIQDDPGTLPILLLELGVPTDKLIQDIGSGLARIALECEKKAGNKCKLLEEPVWTMYCNGKKTGYGAKRDPTESDLSVMKLLHTVSMGAGVLPSESQEAPEGELTYMRAHFDRVVGSKHSETFYMLNPDSNTGPDLCIFFVRL